ncbi:condensin [Culex quinquefasciatus]|uniref:Condensin n=1 Tax=Culex quinquefasciatus TaxID=7176 RepID=B0WAV9_CULQU|nr:condensin [Culex quinquefasciatus]|eukprot:XP_001845843.1 condensin [Culex quinquefasciatus]
MRNQVRILEHCEASIVLIADGVMLLYEDFASLRSTCQTAKHMSQLLGMLAPKLIIPHLSTMSDELRNLESYVMRNCVLHIMGEAIEELADELKETRDDFLHDLFNHTMDVSAHVRSKVLQIRHYIQGQNAVPLSSWQHQVLKGSVERLEDKSLLVRKNSIALILEHNPFSAKLSLAKLRNEERDGRRSAAGNSQQDVRAGPGAQENPTAVGVLHDVLESVLRQDPARPEPERGVPEKENEVNFLKDSIRFAEIVYAAGHVPSDGTVRRADAAGHGAAFTRGHVKLDLPKERQVLAAFVYIREQLEKKSSILPSSGIEVAEEEKQYKDFDEKYLFRFVIPTPAATNKDAFLATDSLGESRIVWTCSCAF